MAALAPAAGTPKLLSAAATGLAGFIESRRLCLDTILGHAGIDQASLSDPVAPLSLDGYCTVLDLAARRSGDDDFGLAYGQQFLPSHLGLIGYIALSSDNALHAAENLASHFRFHQQETSTELIFRNPFYHLTYRIDDSRIAHRSQDAVLTLGMFCNVFRHCAGRDWCPDEVHLEHARTENWRSIEAAFGAPVRFESRTNALLFRPERAVAAMPQADPALLRLMCHNIKTLGFRKPAQSVAALAEDYIRRNIASGSVSLEGASRVLHMPARMLQRRLVEENASFADLVEQVRRVEGRRTLLEGKLDIAQIAYDLGYSEPSAFVRAFSRWFGISPLRFRKMHRIEGGRSRFQ
jgi:AraC-like DNA-binding protein